MARDSIEQRIDSGVDKGVDAPCRENGIWLRHYHRVKRSGNFEKWGQQDLLAISDSRGDQDLISVLLIRKVVILFK